MAINQDTGSEVEFGDGGDFTVTFEMQLPTPPAEDED